MVERCAAVTVSRRVMLAELRLDERHRCTICLERESERRLKKLLEREGTIEVGLAEACRRTESRPSFYTAQHVERRFAIETIGCRAGLPVLRVPFTVEPQCDSFVNIIYRQVRLSGDN